MHHPDQSTLLAYAAGALDESASLIVAAHSERCVQCQADIAVGERVGGALLDGDVPFVDPAGDRAAFERCLARARAASPVPPEPVSPAPLAADTMDSVVPVALQPYVGDDLDAVPWRRLTAGIWHYPLPVAASRGSWIRLFRFAPGVRVPDHGHAASELTLVLTGSYQDALGRFVAGDCADLDDSHEHSPQVDSSEDCIALIASEGHTRFRRPFHRLAGWLYGV